MAITAAGGLTEFYLLWATQHAGISHVNAVRVGGAGLVPALKAKQVDAASTRIRDFLHQARLAGRTVLGYGAPARASTLLNHCGIRSDLMEYTVDRSPVKQGMFLPGTHIPIHAPERLAETRPDYVLVLPWNLREEISGQLEYVRSWGGRLVFPIPALEIV